MNKCKSTKCVSNRDGLCMGNYSECPKTISKINPVGIVISLVFLTVMIILLVTYGGCNEGIKEPELAAVVPTVEEIPIPEVKHGQYTIFHYTKGGWVNRLYVTEYYITDHIIFYKDREHQDEYLEVLLDDCLPQPGWIEDADELMDYGYWEPAEVDW